MLETKPKDPEPETLKFDTNLGASILVWEENNYILINSYDINTKSTARFVRIYNRSCAILANPIVLAPEGWDITL